MRLTFTALLTKKSRRCRAIKEAIMDYEGQKLAEILFYWIILSFGAVGWVIGYIQQDFVVVFYAWLVGVTLSVIVSLSVSNSIFKGIKFFLFL